MIGEIVTLAFTLAEDAPERGYLLPCDGATYETAAYPVLFDRIRYEHGGNGSNTFAVPDLRGRVPMGSQPETYAVGQILGAETVSLTAAHNGPHRHAVNASGGPGNTPLPTSAYHANTVGLDKEFDNRVPFAIPVTMAADMISESGSGEPFSIMQPSAVVAFYIFFK